MKVICIADLAFDPCFTNSSVWGGFSLTCLYWLIIIFLFFHLLHWHCFVQKAKRMQITLCSLFTHFITGLFFFPLFTMNIRMVYNIKNITPWHCAVRIQQQKKTIRLGFYHRWVPTFAVCVCHMPDGCFASMKLVSWNYLRFLSGFTNALSTYWYWMLFFIKKAF